MNDQYSPIALTMYELFLYIKHPEISDFEFAFLIHGCLPKWDSEWIFTSGEYDDVKETLKFLRRFAESKKFCDIKYKNGKYHASFKRWFELMESTGLPMPDDIKYFLTQVENMTSDKEGDGNSAEPSKCAALMTELTAKIEMLTTLFPDIPYRHHLKLNQIESLIKKMNISEERYSRIAGDVCKLPKKPGRPKKGFIDKYLQAHESEETKNWLLEIKKEIQ